MSAQSMDALARGNEIRLGRAALRREWAQIGRAEATKDAAAILTTRGDGLESDALLSVASMTVEKFLKLIPQFDRRNIPTVSRTAGMLRRLDTIRVGDLSQREALALASALRLPDFRHPKEPHPRFFRPSQELIAAMAKANELGWGAGAIGLWIGRSDKTVRDALVAAGVDVQQYRKKDTGSLRREDRLLRRYLQSLV